jgi:hypothetical protein
MAMSLLPGNLAVHVVIPEISWREKCHLMTSIRVVILVHAGLD